MSSPVPAAQLNAPNPAPDWETLLDLETAIENACKTVLTRDFQVAAFTQFELDELPDERIDIQLTVGAETGHRGQNRSGMWMADAWAGTLTFTPQCKRQRRRVSVGLLRGKVRLAVQYFRGAFGPDVLPYLVLTSIVHRNADPQVQVDDDVDLCRLTYDVVISVRSGAWPVA